MILAIDNFGTFIGKEGNRFKVINGVEKSEYSADLLTQIMIIKASAISFGAIRLAMENNIDIVYLGRRDIPHARIYPCKLGGTTLTRRKQLELTYQPKGGDLVKAFIFAKIKNQASLLCSLGKSRKLPSLVKASQLIKQQSLAIHSLSGTPDTIRQSLLGIEGNSGSIYFNALREILPFPGRNKESPDAVNTLLNYGYGMLYGEVERACVIAGLDPYLGFMHTDRYDKPSMVLDLIEEFRQPIVDRTVITLFAQKQVAEADFEEYGVSKVLSKQGREKIIHAILERWTQEVAYKGKMLSLRQIIVEQARAVTRFLLAKEQEYTGFTSRW